MTSPQDAALMPNLPSDSEVASKLLNRRPSPSASLSSLPHRRSNPSLSSLFASTASLHSSRPSSGTATPTAPVSSGSVFPAAARQNPPHSPYRSGTDGRSSEIRALIARGFAPHVGVFASSETEELVKQKGIPGGLLELIRPFGETIQGKVTVRNSVGSSQTFDDFGIRFVGLKDGLGLPRNSSELKHETSNGENEKQSSPRSSNIAWTRTGGDISQIEQVVDRHLLYAEVRSEPTISEYLNIQEDHAEFQTAISPFYSLYLRRLLSGFPLTPHETFAHPVACVIAISSRNPAPLEELRRLYDSTNRGSFRFPQWVNNEFLRYYVLVHDEDNDDFAKSTALFEQMKRHYGLNCHLLRIRSAQALPSDDDTMQLPLCEWMSASEELYEIQRREVADYTEDPSPCIFDTDASSIRIFVRELVAQSVIPIMERLSATWNEQILSRRKGLSGRFMSLSKRWTGFGSSSRNSSSPASGSSSSNYDSLQGFYRPDAPEALMRKLADYAFMLRDYKLAQSTYDLLRSDYDNDKAWKYYAGAHEMTALSILMAQTTPLSSKSRTEAIDHLLETASYSYLNRCAAPFNALRSLTLGFELFKLRRGSTGDDAARWATRILELRLAGTVGRVLLSERVAACYASRNGLSSLNWGSRHRKAGFWALQAAEEWVTLDKITQAEKMVYFACKLYNILPEEASEIEAPPNVEGGETDWTNDFKAEPPSPRSLNLPFDGMQSFIEGLKGDIAARRSASLAAQGYEISEESSFNGNGITEPVVEEVVKEDLGSTTRAHRKSLSIMSTPGGVNFDAPISPLKERQRDPTLDIDENDGFN